MQHIVCVHKHWAMKNGYTHPTRYNTKHMLSDIHMPMSSCGVFVSIWDSSSKCRGAKRWPNNYVSPATLVFGLAQVDGLTTDDGFCGKG